MIHEQHGTRELRSPNHASTTRNRYSRARLSIEQEGVLDTLSASQPCILRSASRPHTPTSLGVFSQQLPHWKLPSCTVKRLSSPYSMLSFQCQITKRFSWRLGSNQRPPLKLCAHRSKEHSWCMVSNDLESKLYCPSTQTRPKPPHVAS